MERRDFDQYPIRENNWRIYAKLLYSLGAYVIEMQFFQKRRNQ